jgi:hypothetical protein
MSNDEGNPNDEASTEVKAAHQFFVIRASLFIRHSDFVIDNRS